MRRSTAIYALAITLALAGCSSDGVDTGDAVDDTGVTDSTDTSEGDIQTEEDPGPPVCEHPCLNDFDQSDKKLCPDPKTDWTCEEGCCEPVFRCASDEDCAVGGFDEGQCTDTALPCVCDVDSGACSSQPCSSSDQCSDDTTCSAGACVETPAEGDVLLRIVSRPSILTPDATAAVRVEGYVTDDPDLSFSVSVTWTSSDPSALAVDESGLVTGGTTGGDALITATHANGQTASLLLRNVVPAGDDTLTVIAVSEGTTTGVTGHYALVDIATGDTVGSGPIPDSGVFSSAHAATEGFDVHVFANGHDWVSHLGVEATTLYAPVARTLWGHIVMNEEGELTEETELVGATVIEGAVDMGDYAKAGEVELTISSLPFTASLFDFNLESILGASVERYFHPDTALPGVDTTEILEIPGGLTFAFGGPAVPTYVLAVPPGRSTLWTLGGRIGIDEVFAFSDDIFEAFDGGNVNFGQIASYLMPFFSDFWSGVSETPDLADEAETTTTVDTLLRIPLSLDMTLMVPPLPALGDLGYAGTVFAIGGALTTDELFYPLGLAAAGDTSDEAKWDPDGIVDAIEETPEQDALTLSLAPLHSGLGGPHTHHAAAVVAVSIKTDGDDPRPEGGSAILVRQSAGAGHVTEFPEMDFLDFTMNTTWDDTSRSATIETIAGADTVRLLFKGKKGNNWAIWLDGRSDYTVPTPSALVAEVTDDRAADPFSTLVSNFDLSDGVTLGALRSPGTPTLEALLHTVDRTSFVGLETFE